MKKQFINFGKQPLANNFLKDTGEKEVKFFLGASFDEETGLVSLTRFVDKEKLFNKNYVYWTSMSKTMVKHFRDAAKLVKRAAGNKILEIGSNDGTFLTNFTVHEAVGVEPCSNFANYTNSMGYKTYNKFWNMETAKEILEKEGKFDAVYAANCFCHIPEIEEAIEASKLVLRENGVLIFEDPSLYYMIENKIFEQLYHEHAHIFSIYFIEKLLKKNGMVIEDVNFLPNIHGGSNRIYAVREEEALSVSNLLRQEIRKEKKLGLDRFGAYENFSEKVDKELNRLYKELNELKETGEKIVAYGATSKSTVLYNYRPDIAKMVDFIIDNTPSKNNKFSPGAHIPVKNTSIPEDVNFVLLTAWNFKKEILEKEKAFLDRGGTFLCYVPFFHKITKDGVWA